MTTTEVRRAESERGELVLRQRDDGSLELRANGVYVMDTVETTSERALASRALGLVESPRSVLIGGLGLGFTLAETLRDRRVEHCTVVEIEPDLIAWMRDGTVPHGPELLSDPRVTVVAGNVAQVLRDSEPGSYDLVLLDVDNGPGYLVHDENAGLYSASTLTDAERATRPGGQVVIWSASDAPELFDAMRESFEAAEEIPYAVELNGRQELYWLYAGLVRPEHHHSTRVVSTDGYYEGTTDPS